MSFSTSGFRFSFLVALLSALAIGAAPAALAANETDLAVRFTATSFRNGSTGLYTITVTNNGPLDTNEPVTANVTLPDGFYLIAGGKNEFTCTSSNGTVACTRETVLPAGTSASLQVRVGVCSQFTRVSTKVTMVYPADIRASNNTYTRVTSVRQGPCLPSPTPVPTQTSTVTHTPTLTPAISGPTLTLPPSLSPTPSPTPTPTNTPVPVSTDLTLTKTSVGAAYVGQSYNYTLSVANVGAAATNQPFTVVDTLPNGLSYATASGVGWSCTASGQIVTCTYSLFLAPATAANMTLTVSVGSGAYPTVTNTAVVSYSGDTNAANNSGNRPTSVRL